MKTYHSAKTGKFVTQEFAEAHPDITVMLTNVNLRQEILNFVNFTVDGLMPLDESTVDEYLKNKP